MPLVTRATGIDETAALLAAQPAAIENAIDASVRLLVERARDKVVEVTTATYNLDDATVREYLQVGGAGDGKGRASLTLKVRALGIEAFNPVVNMVRFTRADSLGRKYANRELPEVRLSRLKGKTPRRVTGAFPLQQRTPGSLQGGERIRKRTSAAREKLTQIRFFTFPRKFVRESLLPAVRAVVLENAGIEVREAYRRFSGGRRQLRNP